MKCFMKTRHLRLIVFLTLPLALSRCFPGGPEYTEEMDMVVTNYDPDFDFQSVGTYALPDDVVKITGNLQDGDDVEFIKPEYAEAILESIRENMSSYGWTEVDKNDDPDIIILPSAMSSTTLVFYYDYWYWSWWYPYSWWGWYYPYPVYGGSYTSGSVFIQMTYPEGMTAADDIPVVWSSILNGLLEGSTAAISSRIESSVNQAYTQSPYLDLGGDN